MKRAAVDKQGHKIKNAAGYDGDNITPNIWMVMVLMVLVMVMVVMVTMVVMVVGDN